MMILLFFIDGWPYGCSIITNRGAGTTGATGPNPHGKISLGTKPEPLKSIGSGRPPRIVCLILKQNSRQSNNRWQTKQYRLNKHFGT